MNYFSLAALENEFLKSIHEKLILLRDLQTYMKFYSVLT